MFTDQEKESIKQILSDSGFGHFTGGTYNFTSGKTTKSVKVFIQSLGDHGAFAAKGLHSLAYQLSSFKDFGNYWKAMEAILNDWSEANRPSTNMINTFDMDDDQAEDPTSYIMTLVPTINLSKNAKDPVILLDPHREHRPVLEINPEVYMSLMGVDLHKLIHNALIKKVFTVFDPYNLKSLFVKDTKKGSIKTWHVNYYVPPKWRFVNAEPKYHGFIKKLVEHLIPNPLEREYVLDWLHYAIVYRNETVLCLIGARGTGKGILLKDILGPLIGEDYREIVNQEILTDKFNGAFKNRRYIFFDEVNVSGDRELNKFKAFCNSTIVVEEKGQDSETVDNYTSLGLSSNDKKDFKCEPQERRFSVPEVTENPLLAVATEDEINNFVNEVANPESVLLAEFGNYLLHRKPTNSARKPLKGKYFFNLCRLSMPEWKSYIIEYIMHEGVENEIIVCSNLSKKFKRIHGENAAFSTKRGTVETFIGDYYHEGMVRIGKVVDAWDTQRGRDTFGILPDPEFLKLFGNNKPKEASSQDDALDSL